VEHPYNKDVCEEPVVSGFCDSSMEPGMGHISRIKPLQRTGSTCDAFEGYFQRRHVFIKRLKDRYRSNPVYQAAFEKEYEIGVSLTHPSLPRYVAFSDNCILMDYVEGETLSVLIARDDIRLRNVRYRSTMMRQLIEVLDYLHHRNVVHCDIKADNIIVSPYPDRQITLIDLDKAYTPWLDDTHGAPAKYGCTEIADGIIDIRGIGMIAGRLGMTSLKKACEADNVDIDRLYAALKPRRRRFALAAVIAAALMVLLAVAVFILPDTDNAASDSVAVEAMKDDDDDVTAGQDSIPENDVVPARHVDPTPVTAPAEVAIDAGWINSTVQSNLSPLIDDIDRLDKMIADSTVTAHQLLEATHAYNRHQQAAQDEIYRMVSEKYPGIDRAVLEEAVLLSPFREKFMREDERIKNELFSEFSWRK